LFNELKILLIWFMIEPKFSICSRFIILLEFCYSWRLRCSFGRQAKYRTDFGLQLDYMALVSVVVVL